MDRNALPPSRLTPPAVSRRPGPGLRRRLHDRVPMALPLDKGRWGAGQPAKKKARCWAGLSASGQAFSRSAPGGGFMGTKSADHAISAGRHFPAYNR